MSRKKGLSFEEKRSRLLEIFQEKKEPLTLKDLEKIAPKEKGIPIQTVKEVLTSLVGDDMVDTDKIGLSIYFWSFPSKNMNIKLNKVKQLQEMLEELKEKDAKLDEKIDELKKNSTEAEDEGEQRMKVQNELNVTNNEIDKLKKEFESYKDCDPEMFAKMKDECSMAETAVNRWTDNVFALKSWCKNKFQMEDKEINNALNIPNDFDYYEG